MKNKVQQFGKFLSGIFNYRAGNYVSDLGSDESGTFTGLYPGSDGFEKALSAGAGFPQR